MTGASSSTQTPTAFPEARPTAPDLNASVTGTDKQRRRIGDVRGESTSQIASSKPSPGRSRGDEVYHHGPTLRTESAETSERHRATNRSMVLAAPSGTTMGSPCGLITKARYQRKRLRLVVHDRVSDCSPHPTRELRIAVADAMTRGRSRQAAHVVFVEPSAFIRTFGPNSYYLGQRTFDSSFIASLASGRSS